MLLLHRKVFFLQKTYQKKLVAHIHTTSSPFIGAMNALCEVYFTQRAAGELVHREIRIISVRSVVHGSVSDSVMHGDEMTINVNNPTRLT